MTSTGYSGTPLIKKLGIKPGSKLLVLNAPENFESFFENSIQQQLVTGNIVPDIVKLFAKDHQAFLSGMKKVIPLFRKNPNMVCWVCWYKKSSGIKTDITEDIIRNFALEGDLVDVKVCAVNEQWSGLKLVMRLSKR